MPTLSFSGPWAGFTLCILISFVLAGCVAVQACSYFSKFHKDPLFLKCAVAVITLGCFLQFVLDCWVLYGFTVSQYDVPSYGIIIPIGFSIGATLDIIVHATAQGIYIFRMYRFGHNRYFLACSCMLVFFELGFGFTWVGRVAVTGVTAVQLDALGQDIVWDTTSFFTISAFVDVFITVSMTYHLMQGRSNGLKRTRHLIDRIIRLTIPTGMLTSSVSIVIVLLWNFDKDSFTWAGMCALEPCCYAAGLFALWVAFVWISTVNDSGMSRLNARRKQFNATDSDQLSLPMTTFLVAPGPTSASPRLGTAPTTTVIVHGLPITLPHKTVQVVRQTELQDRDIHNLKSILPFSS